MAKTPTTTNPHADFQKTVREHRLRMKQHLAYMQSEHGMGKKEFDEYCESQIAEAKSYNLGRR